MKYLKVKYKELNSKMNEKLREPLFNSHKRSFYLTKTMPTSLSPQKNTEISETDMMNQSIH
jgi:hypothetical protein